MKNIYIVWVALILMGLASCENEIDTYSGEEGVYFNKRIRVGNVLTDSTNFTFVYSEADQNNQDIIIPVQLAGRPTDFPRPVSIVVVGGDAVKGVDYELPENPVLPAGAVSFNYVVTLKRSAELQTVSKTLELAIEENEYFSFVITHESIDAQSGVSATALKHKIEFSEIFVTAPAAWWGSSNSVEAFTPQKFFLVCRVMNVSRADFNDTVKMPFTRFNYLILETMKYIQEQQLSDNPDPDIFDENGKLLFT